MSEGQLQPVDRLPPEILPHIAQYVPEIDENDARSIIPLTHVCKYWRGSIISEPRNWVRISNQHINVAEVSLERCGEVPLELFLNPVWAGNNLKLSSLIKLKVENIVVLRICSAVLFGNSEHSALREDVCDDSMVPPSLPHLHLDNIPLYSVFLTLRALKVLKIYNQGFYVGLDTLLDFIEQNHSLESARLDIQFALPSFRDSRPRDPIKNGLRHLFVSSYSTTDIKALISKIAVQEGAHLEVFARTGGWDDISSVVSTPHLSNLRSPTSMEYFTDKSSRRVIELHGPNGSFSLKRFPRDEHPFIEFSLLPLKDIRTCRLKVRGSNRTVRPPHSYFPAIETLVVEEESLICGSFSDPFSHLRIIPLKLKITDWGLSVAFPH